MALHRFISMISWAMSIGLVGAWPGATLAEKAAPAPRPKAPAAARVVDPAKPPIASSKIGAYTLTVEDIRRLEGKSAASLQFNGLPVAANFGLAEAGRQSRSSHQSSSTSGGGGASGGAAGGSAGTYSGVTREMKDANVVVDLRAGASGSGGNHLICNVVGKVTATDDLGHTISAQEQPAHLKLHVDGVEYPEGSGYAAVHLHVADAQARNLKSLQGELLVVEAKVESAVFEGDQLQGGVKRKNGAVLRLDQVETTPQGIDVTASVPMPDPFNDPLNMQNMSNRLRVTLEDSEGHIHKPLGMTGSSSSAGGGGSSGSGTPSGSGRRGSGAGRRSAAPAGAAPMAGFKFQFAPLPEGVTPKRIVCTMTHLIGTPQCVPFRLQDLPLP